MKKLPKVTILTGTLNPNPSIFKKMLDSVRMQDYPKKLIEHLVMDGGSSNDCVKLARNYKCKVIIRHDPIDAEQIRPALGIKMAKGSLVLILESDNILIGKDWILKMVRPFVENKRVFCTYSAYNGYEKNMSATTRYCGLFGSPEPTLYYLDKSEKIPLTQDKYNKGEILEEKKDYYVVKFTKDDLPTLGDNGNMFKKSVITKTIKSPKSYIHVDAFADALELGYDTFGVVKNKVIHMQNPNIFNMLKRRLEVKKIFYDKKRGKRKYLTMNWQSKKDRINLIKYLVFSITFIIPLIESIRGYLKIRDRAWFLHPVLCFLMVFGYGFSEIRWRSKNY